MSISRIYDPLGRILRNPVGFGREREFEVEHKKGEKAVDLIGPTISYWSEIEDRWIDSSKDLREKK